MLGALGVLANANLGLLELVDLLVDSAQTIIVGCAEVLAACELSDIAEGSLVKLRTHRAILHAIWRMHRYTHLVAVAAHTYRVYAYIKGLGDFGCGLRVDVAAVVATVGEQDHHLGLCFRIFHTVHCVRQTQTDGSTIFDHTKLHRLKEVDQYRMVGSQRTLREALACKYHQTDLVVRT